MRRALLVVAACMPRGAAEPRHPATAGISIALYDRGDGAAYSVVDDRRWVDVGGRTLVLDHVDPGAALASLVIEPLGAPLEIGACARDRIPAWGQPSPVVADRPEPAAVDLVRSKHHPEAAGGAVEGRRSPPPTPPVDDHYAPFVRCAVTGAPGRYLVRVLYISTTLRYHAQHDVAITASDRATVTTRFAIATPAWHERADVVLFDGLPGGDQPPREALRGTIALDGATAVLVVPMRAVAARVRRVFDGGVDDGAVAATDPMWRHDSVPDVWVWLELPKLRLAPGPVRVHLELPAEGIRDAVIEPTGRNQDDSADAPLRLPLWIDDSLHGIRQRFAAPQDADLEASATLAERLLITVANAGELPAVVWVEEHLRPARRRRVERAWPAAPTVAGDVLREQLELPPGKVERVGFTIAYGF